jgi:hypothetical protein
VLVESSVRDRVLSVYKVAKPNPLCSICKALPVDVELDMSEVSLDHFTEQVVRDHLRMEEFSVSDGSRCVSSPLFLVIHHGEACFLAL